jgi:hypothetical protein
VKHDVRRVQLGERAHNWTRNANVRNQFHRKFKRSKFKRPSRNENAATRARKSRLAQAMEKAVPGLVIDRPNGFPNFGGIMPWQLEGTYKGQPCYMRFRHDTGGMTVWADTYFGEQEVLSATLWDYTGNEYNGMLDDDELVPFVTALVANLAPVSPENKTSQTRMREALEYYHELYKEAHPADVAT